MESCAIMKRRPEEKQNLGLNPIALLPKLGKPGKIGEILLHWTGNAMYAEPKFKLVVRVN